MVAASVLPQRGIEILLSAQTCKKKTNEPLACVIKDNEKIIL